MKKLWMCLLFCLAFALPCMAEDALPQGVVDLCDARYPAYIIARHDGWGNETQGQYALVLTDGEDNILCIAEKAEKDAAYAFTVENTNAVREGAQLPYLLIDTGGDSLFYSYLDSGLYKTGYHSMKQNGKWGRVSLEYIDTSYLNYDVNIWVGVNNGYLVYDVESFDKMENQIDREDPEYMDIPVSAEFEQKLALASFDIAMLSPEPYFIEPYPGLCAPLMEDGDTLLQMDVQEENILMLVRKSDGAKRLRFTNGWDEYRNDYAIEETGAVPEDAWMDTYHMWNGVLFLGNDQCSFNFTRQSDGKWRFSSVQASDSFSIMYNGVEKGDEAAIRRNDSVVYGISPWNADVTQLDLLNLPRSYDEAVARLDPSAYALVNNPIPTDRLHLREKPSKSAKSFGKFYNRTPVCVLGMEGEWAHVRIGNEADGMEGYMMKEFLAFGSEKENVRCAFPQKFIKESLEGKTGISKVMWGDAYRTITGSSGWYIIGVSDGAYVILT
ncbi:MAG: SH3 domain-containing protein, partial [Clostridia bacterium]|nr:SH3 domain-containing protein [Clostridia bacterium]